MAASNGLEMILNDVIVRLGFDSLKEEPFFGDFLLH